MHVHVLLFGALKDLRARETETAELPEGATVAEFLRGFFEIAPPLEKFAGSLAIAVNQEYALPTQVLRDGDEIALLPPVSGGSASKARRLRKLIGFACNASRSMRQHWLPR